jgi:hypothetical protein
LFYLALEFSQLPFVADLLGLDISLLGFVLTQLLSEFYIPPFQTRDFVEQVPADLFIVVWLCSCPRIVCHLNPQITI